MEFVIMERLNEGILAFNSDLEQLDIEPDFDSVFLTRANDEQTIKTLLTTQIRQELIKYSSCFFVYKNRFK